MSVHDLLGDAVPNDELLADIVSDVIGGRVVVAEWTAEGVPYEAGSPATGALVRVRGTTPDGLPWSLFVKVLQHPRHWLGTPALPPGLRAHFVASFPWRAELNAWDDEFTEHLPTGMRVPRLHRVVELPEDRVAIWMEDVQISPDPWTMRHFVLAARLLGTLAARRSDAALLAASPVPKGYGLRRYYDGPVVAALGCLQEHDMWAHPLLSGSSGTQLRSDLVDLGRRAPAILDRLDELPQSMPHGDASPQNLLIPAGEPDTLVAIDIAFQCPQAIGFDLSQLLIGLVHAGEMPAAELPAVHAALVPAFYDGLGPGAAVSLDSVSEGYLGSLVIRAAFTSLPFREFGEHTPDALISERVALTQFVVAQSHDLPR